ncbi:MAG: YfiR family protein [Rhizomicrobium sp.]
MGAAAALFGAPSGNAADRSLEYAVKATFLYKFAPFVDWPPSAFEQPGAPFVLCIVGNDPFTETVEKTVAGQHVGEHPLVLRHIAVADGKAFCHLMFVAGSPSQSVAQALDAVRGSPTLTVTDSNAPAPGIIQFVVIHDRVNFDIDAVAAGANHLTISSKLLALAHGVMRGDRR